jgi:hypothetical protein
MVTYTAAKLKLAHTIQRTIESLDSKILKLTAKINKILGHDETPGPFKKGKNKMSAAGRARIAAAQKARWAKVKGKGGKPVKKGKRTMSAAAKAKISASAKLRWKKAKAAGKNRL